MQLNCSRNGKDIDLSLQFKCLHFFDAIAAVKIFARRYDYHQKGRLQWRFEGAVRGAVRRGRLEWGGGGVPVRRGG